MLAKSVFVNQHEHRYLISAAILQRRIRIQVCRLTHICTGFILRSSTNSVFVNRRDVRYPCLTTAACPPLCWIASCHGSD
jgi:hypothetical protein